jgi:hypothetical protein
LAIIRFITIQPERISDHMMKQGGFSHLPGANDYHSFFGLIYACNRFSRILLTIYFQIDLQI